MAKALPQRSGLPYNPLLLIKPEDGNQKPCETDHPENHVPVLVVELEHALFEIHPVDSGHECEGKEDKVNHGKDLHLFLHYLWAPQRQHDE